MLVAALMLTMGVAQHSAAQVTIFVTTTQQGVTNGECSLQEAIYSAELKLNIAIGSTAPDAFYTTRCVPGTGKGDTIELPPGAVFIFDHFWDGDSRNAYGPTATPIIFTPMVIEGNGATLQWVGVLSHSGNARLFTVGRVNDGGGFSGTGDLVLRNVYVRGFHIKGGDGGSGGAGGGLGAGGAIFVDGFLTVENSTFENNGAMGGNGGTSGLTGGGGGGLSGDGGASCSVSGGGGGGSRGNGGMGTCGGYKQGGGGGGGTVFSGGNANASGIGGSGGFHCGGNGGDFGNDGHTPGCRGAGGGGGGTDTSFGIHGDGGGASGSYGGGGGGGGGEGGNGGFGGGGGAGNFGIFSLNGGNGGFGGGGGAASSALFKNPGKGGAFGGQADNQNGGGGGALGGAIFSFCCRTQVRNSTFFNNFVTRGVGGGGPTNNGDGASAGGAIFSYYTLEITDSTFSGNQSTGSGGAVVVYADNNSPFASANFTLNNTIIANNGANECFYRGSVNVEGKGNLIMKNGSGASQFSPCPGVVTTNDPQLHPLQLTSPGKTPTIAIFSGSSAINKGDPGTSLPWDQRGIPRPQLGGFDIGAFEARGDGR